jgi:hypothetical protein
MKTILRTFVAALLLTTPLAGCDLLGIESASALAARKEAESKAVGSACRHAGRAIEDCYALNKQAHKAAVFAGWREMNDYMRDKKIEEVVPKLDGSAAATARKPAGPDDEDDARDPAPAAKTAKKAPKH